MAFSLPFPTYRISLRLAGVIAAACVAVLGGPTFAADGATSPESRLRVLEATDFAPAKDPQAVIAACRLRPGAVALELGVAPRTLLRAAAEQVGAEGKVFVLDREALVVEQLKKAVGDASAFAGNVAVCSADATGLAPRSVDAALACDASFDFTSPKFSASLHETLRPGGRLVVVRPRTDDVDAKLALVEALTAVGFRLDAESAALSGLDCLTFVKTLRPPATPLVVHDPYFSIWAGSDHLAGDWPKHWTGATHALMSMVRIDGRPFRIMGAACSQVPTMRQVRRDVLPTRTIYEFEKAGVRVRLTFISPILRGDLERIARPLTYLQWEAWSVDGGSHDVAVYYDNSAEPVVHDPAQPVVWSRPESSEFAVMRIGTEEQPVLAKVGDFQRIDWGYLYTAATKSQKPATAIGSDSVVRKAFVEKGRLPEKDDTAMPRPANRDWPVAACMFSLGKVAKEPVSCRLMLAYDDVYSIEYLGVKLRPYWRRNGAEIGDLLSTAEREFDELKKKCEALDAELMQKLQRLGGPGYADLCALAYRQAMAGHKLAAGPKGEPMLFPKENSSNGCIATVDVIYPAAPFNYFMSNDLLKASLTPVFEYSITPRWKFPFAPHDMGTYPKANGQVYGGGEKTEENQMPVEESGNMLILAALVCRADGNTDYIKPYWTVIDRWAEYLRTKGLDPANQLCTDDFAGHLAHNANLSLKAIVAMAAYSQLCDMAGRTEPAKTYRKLAEEYAAQWQKLADDGDHYRLAFDRPGTWSQKYNLVWDRLLIQPALFGDDVLRKELDFYPKKMNRYGLPLDNRETYTKTDWHVWTASITGRRDDFDAVMGPVYDFVSRTPQRVPMVDWYMTKDAALKGFIARPVIGGVFIYTMHDPAFWNNAKP